MLQQPKRWSSKLPLLTGDIDVDAIDSGIDLPSSWLDWQSDMGLGCIACGAANVPGRLAQFQVSIDSAMLINLEKHHKSGSHQVAVKAYVTNCKSCVGAPSFDDFATVWMSVKQGTSPTAGISGIGQQKKLQKMIWCLRESITRKDAEILAAAACIGVFRDEASLIVFHVSFLPIKFCPIPCWLIVNPSLLC